jgi:hypothetical protein
MRGLFICVVTCVLAACGFDRAGVQLGDDEPAADADPGAPDAGGRPPDAAPDASIDAPACGADPDLPPDAVCPPECTGGCQGGTCAIDCTGADACRQDNIVCPDGYTCSVSCSGDRACERATIECPAYFGCAISCETANACTDAEVRCGAGVCEATCSSGEGGGGPPEGGGGGVAPPTVTCGTSCACSGCFNG